MTNSHDALEVAEVLSQKLGPLYRFVAAMVMILIALGGYVYSSAQFMAEDAMHERQQDENLLELKKLIGKNGEGFQQCRGQNLKTVELIITDLDLLRSHLVQLLPRGKREQARRDFAAQHQKSVHLLVGAQR